jgi:hypothetical protein
LSERTGIMIGIVGLILAVPGTVVALNEMGTISIFPQFRDSSNDGDSPNPGEGCGVQAPAEVTLSTGSARRGAEVTVYGSCFKPGERIAIRVHAEEVGSATADCDGKFTQTIKIPSSAPQPGFPTSISATGRTSIKSASAPFTVAR